MAFTPASNFNSFLTLDVILDDQGEDLRIGKLVRDDLRDAEVENIEKLYNRSNDSSSY